MTLVVFQSFSCVLLTTLYKLSHRKAGNTCYVLPVRSVFAYVMCLQTGVCRLACIMCIYEFVYTKCEKQNQEDLLFSILFLPGYGEAKRKGKAFNSVCICLCMFHRSP